MIHCHGMQVRSGMPESIINNTHLFHNKIKHRSQLNSFTISVISRWSV